MQWHATWGYTTSFHVRMGRDARRRTRIWDASARAMRLWHSCSLVQVASSYIPKIPTHSARVSMAPMLAMVINHPGVSIDGRWRADGELQTTSLTRDRHTGVPYLGGPVLSKPLGSTTNRPSRRNWRVSGELRADGHRVASAAAPQVAIRSGLQQGSPGEGQRILFSSYLSAVLPCNLYGRTHRRDVAWAGTEFPHARLYVIWLPEPAPGRRECEDGKG